MCDEPFCEVISVSLHMSVITQDGDTALMMAAREGRTEVVSLLLGAGANIHLQNKVKGLCREVYLIKYMQYIQYHIVTHVVMV